MMSKYIWWGKVVGSQLGAFIVAGFLVTYVFIGPTPIISPTAKTAVHNLPQTIVQLVKNVPGQISSVTKYLASKATLAPPWINGSSPINQDKNQKLFPTGGVTPATNSSPVPTIISDSNKTPTPNFVIRLPTLPPLPPLPTFGSRTGRSGDSPSRNTPFPTVSSAPPPPSDTASLESQIINLINSRRSQDGLGRLTQNSSLTAAARRHSTDISNRDYCGHDGSDGSDPYRRAREAGFTGSVYGETVACRHRTPESAVSGWWASPGHHAILTKSGIKQIGVGWVGNYQTALVAF